MKFRQAYEISQLPAGYRLYSNAPTPCGKEKGITLILVLVLLIITAAASVYFHNSMVGSTRISGANRDNDASLLLVESALEKVRGGFVNTLSTTRGTPHKNCKDIVTKDGAVIVQNYDKCEAYWGLMTRVNGVAAWEDKDRLSAALALANLNYIFFVNNAAGGVGGITVKMPSILQNVANGEAANNLADATRVASAQLVTADTSLYVEDLFGATFQPLLFEIGTDPDGSSNGLLVTSDAASWAAETSPEKAAVWIEVTRHDAVNVDPKDATGGIDLWVQAVAQVGYARSYLQRYVGTFYPPNRVGNLAALIEASNVDRRLRP